MPRFDTTDLTTHTLVGSTYGYSGTRIDRLGATEMTLVAIAADTSGSVHPFKREIEACIQEAVRACRQAPRADNLMLRLVQFADTVKELHGFKPLVDCPPDPYAGCLRTGGCTALHDAAHNAIGAVTAYGRDLVARGLTANAIVFVITDGEDNASRMTPGAVRLAVEEAVTGEHLESVVTVLVGVNVKEARVATALMALSTQAGFDHYLELDKADASTLARLADFLSRSIQVQSQALDPAAEPDADVLMDVVAGGRRTTLGPACFVARGGEASVYARDGVAWKIYADAARTPPEAKLAALRALAAPGVVAPIHTVHSPTGERVGLTLPLLDGWSPLVRLFPPAFQKREGIDVDAVVALVDRLRHLVHLAHAGGAVVGDLNEVNVLVRPDWADLALIDVDSWAIAGFPATALAESVRDRHAARPSMETDWFAFAVLAFQLLVGVHPYRGRHPTARTLDARMQQDLAVFHPDVVVPPMVDLARLPPGWRGWFEDVLLRRHRGPPPSDPGAPVSRAAQTATGVTSETLRTHDGPVLGLAASPEGLWTWTADATFLAGRRMGPAPPAGAVPLVDGPPVRLLRDGEHVEAVDLEGQRRPTGVAVRELVSDGSRVLALCGGTLARLRVRHVGGDRVVVAVPLATIQPACTVLFRGCAVTAGPHGTWLHRATAAGVEQVRVRALDDAVVVDAHSGERATVVVARRPSGLVRLVVADGTVTEAATDDPTAILVELPGVLLVQDGGTLHLRDARTPHAPGRSVQAALPPGVVAHAGRPTAAEGPAVLTFSLRGPHDA